MIRALVALAGLAAAASAAAATVIPSSPVAAGTTEPTGAQAPVGYLALDRAHERRWTPRLESADRAKVAAVDLRTRAAVAVFLDGRPCASKLAVGSIGRSGSALNVTVAYTAPRIGMATCVRTSTAYVVLSVPRKALRSPVPTRVVVTAHARS